MESARCGGVQQQLPSLALDAIRGYGFSDGILVSMHKAGGCSPTFEVASLKTILNGSYRTDYGFEPRRQPVFAARRPVG
jgi:hypothetical protein